MNLNFPSPEESSNSFLSPKEWEDLPATSLSCFIWPDGFPTHTISMSVLVGNLSYNSFSYFFVLSYSLAFPFC